MSFAPSSPLHHLFLSLVQTLRSAPSTSFEQQEIGKAKDALRKCTRHGFESILDRWNGDDQYREISRDVLGSNDHSYHAKKEEKERYKQI